MSADVPAMPDPIANGSMIPTLDQQGAIWLFIDAITQAYLDFVAGKVALEIAAGYGHVVIRALDHGARQVFANEADPGQLAIIRARTPEPDQGRLVCCQGRFPEALDFDPASFDAVYCARLFHFFGEATISSGLEKIHRWLKPGGKLFLVNDAIYRTIFKPLIPTYEARVLAGEAWPGWFEDVRSCIPQALHPENFPKAMNFLDPAVLSRELNHVGFEVETAAFVPYTGGFAPAHLDGRELAAAVARRL